MTLKEEVLQHKYIFSLMYSPNRFYDTPLKKQIVKIEVSDLKWSEDQKTFIYIWGWPGPDCNVYTRSTYGKGWAYTEQEILKAWENEE